MKASDRLLLSNKAWAAERMALDPELFQRLARDQKPTFLWIGCSDSRVPANEVTGTYAGEIFVHRNIANLVSPQDENLASVLQYAIDVLKVEHVIVCGHHGCGGVRAAMGELPPAPLGTWLARLQEVYLQHRKALDLLAEADRANALCELSVRAQVATLAQSPFVRAAFQRGQALSLHGWAYGLRDGLIRELVAVSH